MDEKEHQRLHEQGVPHDHSGEHHGHTHSHQQTKAVLNRISRAIGHLERVRQMVEDGKDCTEVLIQLAAVRSAPGAGHRPVCKMRKSRAAVTA